MIQEVWHFRLSFWQRIGFRRGLARLLDVRRSVSAECSEERHLLWSDYRLVILCKRESDLRDMAVAIERLFSSW